MIRDKKYLAYIRSQPCLFTGQQAAAAHLRMGTNGGIGIKPDDCYVLPLSHEMHQLQHQMGEPSFYRLMIVKNDWLIREALIAFCEKQYREWKNNV